jgi:hypothetical protein
MDRRIILLLVLAIAWPPDALPISKCKDAQGRLVFVQTRSCPANLEALSYEPQPLNSLMSVAPLSVPKPPPVRKSRARDVAKKNCQKIKLAFAKTDAPCRGIKACRKRNQDRDRHRAAYKQAFCVVRTGAIHH